MVKCVEQSKPYLKKLSWQSLRLHMKKFKNILNKEGVMMNIFYNVIRMFYKKKMRNIYHSVLQKNILLDKLKIDVL